jgi:hypothetical protein
MIINIFLTDELAKNDFLSGIFFWRMFFVDKTQWIKWIKRIKWINDFFICFALNE